MSGLESKCQGVRQAAYLLILCVAFLLTFGAVVIYSASMHEEGYHLLAKHLVFVALGLCGAFFLAWKDYAWIQKNALWFFCGGSGPVGVDFCPW